VVRGRLAVAVSLSVVSAAAEPPRSPEPHVKWEAPEDARARPNPVDASPAALRRGQELYGKHCASCHGDKGRGDGPAEAYNVEKAADLTDRALQDRLTDGEILWKITTGLRSAGDEIMPALAPRVAFEEDRWKIVCFVRTLAAPAKAP
jgi:mono/diheme cytochrome c family protein